MKHLVLFSAGLDSTVILYWLLTEVKHTDIVCSIADYNQSSRSEIDKAVEVCRSLNIKYFVKKYDFMNTDNTKQIYGRNVVFVSNAIMDAKMLGCKTIYIGSCADDISIDAQEPTLSKLGEIAKYHDLQLEYPLLKMSKEQILRQAIWLGVDFTRVHSCRNNVICGKCKTCEFMNKSLVSIIKGLEIYIKKNP